MNCDDARANISALLDGELGSISAWMVRRHAAGCPSCRSELESIRAMGALLLSCDIVESLPVANGTVVVQARESNRLVRQVALACACLAAAVIALCIRQGILPVRRTGSENAVAVRRESDSHRTPNLAGEFRDSTKPLRIPHWSAAKRSPFARSEEVRRAAQSSQRNPNTEDLTYLNPNPARTLLGWSFSGRDSLREMKERIDRTVLRGDDFIEVPYPRIASADPRSSISAMAAYRRERQVVDARLARSITVSVKGISFADFCKQLKEKTGIGIRAARSVEDEKVTVFCDEQPLRDIMRAVNQVFGYHWARSGEQGAYEYELSQDLRSQLAEEEMRSQDQHAALTAIDDRLTGAKDPQSSDALAAALYGLLSPSDLAGLRSGRDIRFCSVADGSGRPLPDSINRLLPHVASPGIAGSNQSSPPLPSGAGTSITLRMDGAEVGQWSLSMELAHVGQNGESLPGVVMTQLLATGRNPSSSRPDNAKTNESLRGLAAFQRLISLHPKPSCPLWSGARPAGQLANGLASGPTGQRAQGAMPEDGHGGSPSDMRAQAATQARMRRSMRLGRHIVPGEPEQPHVSTADVWEAVHAETGMTIVADYYTHLYPKKDAEISNVTPFDALCKEGDLLGARWRFQDGYLLCRDSAFFWDKLKEVPNRLISRWKQNSSANDGLPVDDLIEMSGLSDQQGNSEVVGEGIEHCSQLPEWELLVSIMGYGPARPWVRLLAGLAPSLRAEALGDGLQIGKLPPDQQQAASSTFSKIMSHFGTNPPDSRSLFNSRIRIDYVPSGRWVWVREIKQGESITGKERFVSGKTAEEALAAARKLNANATSRQIQRLDGALAVWLILPDGSPAILAGNPLIIPAEVRY